MIQSHVCCLLPPLLGAGATGVEVMMKERERKEGGMGCLEVSSPSFLPAGTHFRKQETLSTPSRVTALGAWGAEWASLAPSLCPSIPLWSWLSPSKQELHPLKQKSGRRVLFFFFSCYFCGFAEQMCV